jgi:diguanylate cyclase (GGDEF)-like protein/PAS domain S-box-containing protein
MFEALDSLAMYALLEAVAEARADKDRDRVIELIEGVYALLDGDTVPVSDLLCRPAQVSAMPPDSEVQVPSGPVSDLLNDPRGRRSRKAHPAVLPAGSLPQFAFAQIVDTAGDIIIVTDTVLEPPGPFIVYVNSAFSRLSGFSAEEAIGKSPRMLQGPGTSRQALDRVAAGLRANTPVHEKVLNYSKSGAPYWLDMRIVPLYDTLGQVTHFAAIERDVTMDKRRLDELEYLADRDTLTGIPNRRALLRGLNAELDATAAGCGGVGPCLALIDVDLFKQVNDTLGHPAGDAVLTGLADRLTENVRRLDVLGRLGGEEFAVCMPNVPLQDAVALAERLRRAVAREPFDTPAGPVRLTVSIGVAGYVAGGESDELLVRADAALYRAKQVGRNSVRADVDAADIGVAGSVIEADAR